MSLLPFSNTCFNYDYGDKIWALQPLKISLNPQKKPEKVIRRDPAGKTATAKETSAATWTLPTPMEATAQDTPTKVNARFLI